MNAPNQNASWRLDLFLFSLAFLLGAIAILVLKPLGVPQGWVTGIVIAIILAYGAAAWIVPRLRLRLDQAGDNAYYLGLLFTLLSMAVALYREYNQAGRNTADSETHIQQIIGDFGIALGSTIVGIFVRIFLNQIRIDPSDIENISRLELGDASLRLKAVLDEIGQHLQLSYDTLQQRTEDLTQKLSASFAKSVHDLNQRMDAAGTTFSGTMTNSSAAVMDGAVAMREKLTASAGELQGVTREFNEATAPLKQLNTRLVKIADSLERTNVAIDVSADRFGNALTNVNDIQNAMAALTRQLEDLVHRLPERDLALVDRIETTLRAITVSQADLAGLGERQAAVIREWGTNSERAATAVTRAQASSNAVLTAITALLKQFEVSVRNAPPPQQP